MLINIFPYLGNHHNPPFIILKIGTPLKMWSYTANLRQDPFSLFNIRVI